MTKKEILNNVNSLMSEFMKVSDDHNFDQLLLFMKSKEIKNVLNDYLHYKTGEDLDDDDLKFLKTALTACNTIYTFSGEETGLSDSDYDALVSLYNKASNEPLEITVQDKYLEDQDVHHKYLSLRGTLDKIYQVTEEDILKNQSQESLKDWVKKTERKLDTLGVDCDLWNEDIYVFPKFDGCSCVFEFDKNGNLERALTRGDTKRNTCQNISFLFKNRRDGESFTGPIVDSSMPYGLKTEIMMFDQDLDRFNKEFHTEYKNTRSVISAIINNRDNDRIDMTKVWNNTKDSYIHIVPLRVSFLSEAINSETNPLRDTIFESVTTNTESAQELPASVFNYPYIKCKLKDVDKIHKFAFENRNVLVPKYGKTLRADGAVIYIINKKLQFLLGRSNEKMKYEVAFKYTEETAYSVVKDVVFSLGLFGVLTPICKIEPVKLKGNKISKASLGSYQRMKMLRLSKGDVVKVLYDVIPYIDFDLEDLKCVRSGRETIEPPNECPECGKKLEISEDGGILKCVNDKCPCRVKGKILNYLNKLDISEISYNTINDFYDAGYLKNIKDLYKLKKHKKELEDLDGYGKKSIQLILNEIDNHRHIKQSELLGAIGIDGVSIKTFHNILQSMSYEDIKENSLDGKISEFVAVKGIKQKTAEKIIKGIRENIKLIEFLEEEMDIEIEDTKKYKFSVVFTNIRSKEMENFINQNGGEVKDHVTSDTSVLCVPALGISSNKVTAANKYNIPIVDIDNLSDYIIKNLI